jgi:hypothetical protein
MLIVGPPGSGKRSFASRLAPRLALENPPKVLCLHRRPGAEQPVVACADDGDACAGLETFAVDYCPERVFEYLPVAIKAVRGRQKFCTTFVLAEPDPSLRYAFGYAGRVFLLPPTLTMHQVFRPAKEAALALQEVMQDTAAFASEIFGLFEHGLLGAEDAATKTIVLGRDRTIREQVNLMPDDVRRFLATPLGVEIASRIQLQPTYHGLAESDVIVVNAGAVSDTAEADRALRSVEMFLARIADATARARPVFQCDFSDDDDPMLPAVLRALNPLLRPPADPY